MQRCLLVAASILVLAACGSEPVDPKNVDEVIAEAGKLEKPRPGQYETTAEMVEFTVPGLPPQQAEQIKAMMGKVSGETTTYCLTPEEAEKGFEENVRKMAQGKQQMNCEFARFDVDGDKLDAAMACKGPQGMTADLTLAGTTSSEASSMRMTMVQKAQMIPGGEMRMEMQMDAKRIGDCPA